MTKNAKPSLKKAAVYITGALSGVLLTLSLQTYAQENRQKQPLPIDSIRTMAEVYGQIKANYFETKPDDDILEGAMKGMVGHLDPHSEYLNVKDYHDIEEHTTGEFGGLGMEIGSEDGFIKVIAPIEDTPAERAGVKSGDFIVKINQESTRGLTVTEAVKKMRGKPGTNITLTLSRKDSTQPIVIKLTRAIIKVKSVRYHLLEPGYGYIRVIQFQERTVPSVANAIHALIQQNKAPLKGLVLDLRDDPGGLLNSAVGVSATFLPKGSTVVRTKGRNKARDMHLTASPENYMRSLRKDPLAELPEDIRTIPLTVLINSGSASASEIVAGALQDHKRAVIVGTQSFGKGSVQTIVPLSNGGAVKLTTALYYTPNDRSIQAKGITPDVEVKDKKRKFESREADLAGHIGNPLGGKEVNGQVLNIDEADDKLEKSSQNQDPENTAHQESKDKQDDDILARRIPNPKKDEQLKVALDLVKHTEKWQQSLGLSVKKEANTNTKQAKTDHDDFPQKIKKEN